jgi:hypothetical protein
VVPGPRVFVDGVDPSTGEVVHTTVYSGYVGLAHNAAFRGMVTANDAQAVTFFLPDSLPYPTPPAALGLELGIRRYRSDANVSMVTIGGFDELVTAVPDPRGGDQLWLQVRFRTPVYGNRLIELNYRVTAQTR